MPHRPTPHLSHLSTLLCLALVLGLAGCGGGQDSPTTTPTDTPVGTKQALAVTTRLAVPLAPPADPLLQGLSIPADAAQRGMWGAVQNWPMNPIHMALLPDGKLLSYGAPQGQDAQDGRTFSVWTPALGFANGAHATSFSAGRVNSFCSTATWLGDGRLLITGGNTPRGSQLYTTATLTAANDTAQLADDRWYATMITLSDGRALMLGGIDPYQEPIYQNPDNAVANGLVSMTPELYTPGTGWRSLTGASSRLAFGPDYLRASFPRAWVAPNGEVFGISADQMWWLDATGNGGAGALRSAGVFKGAPSATNPLNVGTTNSAVMFAPGRILQVGGNGGFNGDGLPASNMATVVDINSGTPQLSETNRMAAPRRFASATVLANGQVLVTGGTRRGNNGGTDAVYGAEIWNPATGQWTAGPNAARIRVYHSGALLMPNGTVLSGGGGTPGPVFNQNVEVYYPPYLFRNNGSASVLATRPVMTGINALTHTPGQTLQVEMRDSATVARLVLVKAGIVTHGFNNGQRFIPLNFTQAADLLQAPLPSNGHMVPPGLYQLFAIDPAGVPSQAALIRINAAPQATASLPRDVLITLHAGHVADGAVAIDAQGLGVLQALGATPDATLQARSQWRARSGLGDAACVSLELAAQPGRYLRHRNYRLELGTPDGTALFQADATFCPEPGVAGSAVALRSKNVPDRVLRARDNQLWIDPAATDTAFRSSASFSPTLVPVQATPLPALPVLPAAPVPTTSAALTYTPGLDAAGLSFSWSFGDGTAATAFAASSAASHNFAQPGAYTVTLTVRNAAGQTASTSFLQAVYSATTATAPRNSSALLLEPRNGSSARLWVLNPDNDSVGVIDTASNTRVADVAVGGAPRSLARAPNGQVWVVNRDSASISVIDPATLTVQRSLALPRASQPYGLVFAPDNSAAFVTLEAGNRLLKLDVNSGATLASLATGATPRGLAISGDSRRLLVSRFVTAPLPGEATAQVNTAGNVGGEVWALDATTLVASGTAWLRHSDKADGANQGSGVPNYLGAPVIAPDGRTAWVPSKQDNIRRGVLRNGLNLDFQNTVRAVSSAIDLTAAAPAEQLARRIDHDNASLASAAAFDPTGAYLFVALETTRQVAVVDAARGLELFRIEVGLAPQAVLVSPDGLRLYVQNFLSRQVSVLNLEPLRRNGLATLAPALAVASQASEKLAANVLRGKQLFYDARDPRLARDSYMSCASCHNDGGHDGRVWDLTGMGEGLRNTIHLRGRAGLGHGRLHWSNNFDEVQDFEGQIRRLAGGTGLLSDAQFNTGTRSQPLGEAKAGLNSDLDALAAYVGSLNRFAPSAARPADGSLGTLAATGRAVFVAQNCAACHSGANFSRSGVDNPANIGTLKPSSGTRLGATLSGIDVPTLRDVASTAPYLHDGSAATLEAAVQAHAGNAVAGADLAALAQYLREIGNEEASAPAPVTPPPPPPPTTGLRGQYFSGTALAGSPLLTRYEAVNFDWGTGSPGSPVPADRFSVRWAGTLTVPSSGSWRFRTVSDDGVRLWVNNAQRINRWTDHSPTTDTSVSISLSAGQRVPLVLEYYENGGGAVMRLQWRRPGSLFYETVPLAQLSPP